MLDATTHLCLDIGNTWVKIAVYSNDGHLLYYDQQPDLLVSDITALRKRYATQRVLLSSTRRLRKSLLVHLQKHYDYMELSHHTPIPIHNGYETPATLGRDRLAASIGAWARAPHNDHLIIDAGTCITYDVVHNGTYIGGNIAPGIHMRLRAMHDYTDKLPLVTLTDTGRHLGTSTTEALQNGALIGTICEVESFIQRTEGLYPGIKVSITGGDGKYLADRIESDIFVAPKLVLEGLYTISNYNAD